MYDGVVGPMSAIANNYLCYGNMSPLAFTCRLLEYFSSHCLQRPDHRPELQRTPLDEDKPTDRCDILGESLSHALWPTPQTPVYFSIFFTGKCSSVVTVRRVPWPATGGDRMSCFVTVISSNDSCSPTSV